MWLQRETHGYHPEDPGSKFLAALISGDHLMVDRRRSPRRAKRGMRILSWNVNGLRSVMGKGFLPWLDGCGADIVGLQEVRASQEQLSDAIAAFAQRGWHFSVSVAEKKGYSGVGLLSRVKPDALETTLGVNAFDVEGRVQRARFGSVVVVNAYFPNGNGTNRDNSRIPFKLAFYQRVFELLESERRRGTPLVVMGDFNTAHTEIDLARAKTNHKTSGFTPAERGALDRWLTAGWVDSFREFESGAGHYSWWSQRGNVRERNVGWRIDLMLVSGAVRPFLQAAFIAKDVMGSDHCPIGIDLESGVLG